ncbi:MAG: endolytic transglycosylase MltG, partial [Atopobiaceae bacterium]|nr:endolytic transglycosylase MltG [Atopobiaceae bacterium]
MDQNSKRQAGSHFGGTTSTGSHERVSGASRHGAPQGASAVPRPSRSQAGRAGAARPAGRPSAQGTPSATRMRPSQPTRRASQHNALGSTGVSARTARTTQAATPRTRAQRERYARGADSHASKLPFIVGGAVAAVVILVLVLVVMPRLTSSSTTETASTVAAGQMVQVAIPDGSGASSVAKILKDAGVISTTDEFMKEVSNQKADQSLQPGTYSLMTGATVSEVVQQLVAGPASSSTKLTLPEGYTVTKTAALVESTLGISADDFTA